MPRFVILQHDWPTQHWDFLLETGPMLRAWRFRSVPCTGVDLPTEPNTDHRPLYLDYEGPVSGGRGEVLRWDFGVFNWLTERPDLVEIEVHGAKLAGRCVIWQPSPGTWITRFD